MSELSILLVNDAGAIRTAMDSLLAEGEVAGRLTRASSVDGALEAIVTDTPDLCFICEGNSPADADALLAGVAEAGVKVPVLVFMGAENNDRRRALLKAGAIAAIHSETPRGALIDFALRNAFTRKASEARLRDSNERLVRELLDNQDARERAEQLTGEYAEMAEELHLAKEELEKLNQEKNKFFSILAHDLKSPFNAILGFSNLLVQLYDDMPPEEVRECAEQVHGAGERAFEMLENLLEWGRLQMNRTQPHPEDLDMDDVAGRTLKGLGAAAAAKKLTLHSAVNGVKAHGDLHMTDTVIRNMVNNAIKFTPTAGAVTIAAVPKNGMVEIRVTDTGVGMPPDRAASVFSVTGAKSTTGTGGERGTGLGLLLCKDMVEKMGGQIRVESEEGQGSTFAFTLPQARGA